MDANLDPLEDVLGESDLLIIGTPHEMYRDLEVDAPIIDIWNLRGGGVRV